MNIKKELVSNQIVLLLMPSAGYSTLAIKMLKQLSGSICYVTLNKTYGALKELFQKNGINTKNVVFIDGISKTIGETPSQTEGCYFVESPAALTEISLCITKLLQHNFDYIIFDSLTNLLIYEKKAPVARFVSIITTKIRATKTKALFYTLSITEQQELIKETEMFVDKVIDLGKRKKLA